MPNLGTLTDDEIHIHPETLEEMDSSLIPHFSDLIGENPKTFLTKADAYLALRPTLESAKIFPLLLKGAAFFGLKA